MITETITYRCTRCQSTNIVPNGRNASGNPKFLCNECGASRALNPKARYTDEQKQLILRAYHERYSPRSVQRLFGVPRSPLIAWIKKVHNLPAVQATVAAARADDVLEIDEMWSYVGKKGHRVWLWRALCRRTRQMVAFAVGDWSEATCRCL